ncbi:unnamed protein product [Phyllotreta striolata]|uniref:Uncharacterized protein n=1 Tax=Phyllotreta striolata TaxID=444603 RepID=A0A9N9XKJ0_PHYSR|nr:unnamed protein product [Phyllotreta striolata]
MASQEDDNKLECFSNVNKQHERYFLNVYKKHEYILNNKNESFENKIESLIDVWRSIAELNLSQFDLRHVIQIMDWAKLHALNIVLTAEWNSFKVTYQSKLLDEIGKAQNELLKLNNAFATPCKKLADVVKNPWEDPVLMKLMKTKDAEINTEEIEFFCVETVYLVSVRLKKLCESHCEDLALNLVTAFMNCNKLSKTQNFSLNATETQMWFIFDIYIALLYKFQDKQKIVVLLKELSFDEGLQLVKRFAKKRVKISKIWKNCQRIAILAVQLYISQAVVKYTEELKEILENYIEIYISLCNTEVLLQDFSTSIRRISNLADAAGLYIFCSVMQRKAGTPLKPLVVEMYIRALTTDMNELERQKDANESEKVSATTSRLAEAFCNLADFLDEHVKVARECVLTAFSLEPTKQRLEYIETLAKRSGFQVLDTGQEWKCKLHPPTSPSDEITWMCPECGDWMSKPEFNVPIKINMALNEALQNSVLGISESLCDDLVVCLSNPRYQILSWFLPWEDLHRLCLMYLQDPQATKNIVTELKFVDIDYSIFKGIKREPLDEYDGIERGYEQYLDQDFVSDEETTSNSEDSMSQDSRPYSLGSDGAGEGPYLPMLPVQSKSDPNTLKSLRMFRHNLKRGRDKEIDEGAPEKLFKSDTNIAAVDAVDDPIEPQNIDTNICNPTLNQLLNGVAAKMSTVQYPNTHSGIKNPSNKDFHSKNVKTATLPLLGGQVAKKENTLIQVNLKQLRETRQEIEIPSHMKIPVSKIFKKKPPKKDQKVKTLNKSLWSGLKESSSYSLSSRKMLPESRPTSGVRVYKRKPRVEPTQATNIPRTQFNQIVPTAKRESFRTDLVQDTRLNQAAQSPHQQYLITPNLNSQIVLSVNQQISSLHQTFTVCSQNQAVEELGSHQTKHSGLEQPEILHTNSPVLPQIKPLTIPLVALQSKIVEKCLNTNCLTKNYIQQCKDSMRDIHRSTQTSESSKTINSNQPYVPLIKVEHLQPNLISTRECIQTPSVNQNQIPIKHLVSTNQTNKQEKSPNSSYQCLKQPQQEVTKEIMNSIHNQVLQIPIKRLNIVKEVQEEKQSENCSSLFLKREIQLEEHQFRLQQPLNQTQHTTLKCHSLMFQSTSTREQTLKQKFHNQFAINCFNPQTTQEKHPLEIKTLINQQLQESVKETQYHQITHTTQSSHMEKTFLQCNKIFNQISSDQLLPQHNRLEKITVTVNPENFQSTKTYQHSHSNSEPTKSILLPPKEVQNNKDPDLNQTLINRNSLHSNCCSSLKVPSHCPNLDKSLISQDNQAKLPQTPKADVQTTLQDSQVSTLSTQTHNMTLAVSDKILRGTSPSSVNKPMNSDKPFLSAKHPENTRISQKLDNNEIEICQTLKNFCNSLNIINKNDQPPNNTAYDLKEMETDGCNKNETVDVSSDDIHVRCVLKNINYELFSDLHEAHSDNIENCDLASIANENEIENADPEDLPKNINLTENIRTYTKKSKRKLLEEYKDSDDKARINCQTVVNSSNTTPTIVETSQAKPTEQTVLNNTIKTTNSVVKNTNTSTTGQGSTILQFICKSSLPKFQQAFGKTVYQNNNETSETPTTTVEVVANAATEVKKTFTTKTVPVNLQPIPGSVIYSRQLPAGQAISLLPSGTATTRQVFRIATSNAEQLGLVKDSVIHSKMSALLAAALQGRPKTADGEIILNSDEIKEAVVRPALVQGARIVKPVQLQMATNVVRSNTQQPNLSSTTLEQLREFDMVYKQIKERSTTSISETCTNAEGQEGIPQRISVTYVNQLQKYTQLSPVVVVTSYSNLQPAASPALSVTSQGSSSPCVTPASTPTLPKLATKNSKGKTIKTTTPNNTQAKSSPIPKPQQKPQEDEHTTQRIFDILAEYAEQTKKLPRP